VCRVEARIGTGADECAAASDPRPAGDTRVWYRRFSSSHRKTSTVSAEVADRVGNGLSAQRGPSKRRRRGRRTGHPACASSCRARPPAAADCGDDGRPRDRHRRQEQHFVAAKDSGESQSYRKVEDGQEQQRAAPDGQGRRWSRRQSGWRGRRARRARDDHERRGRGL
jgi:hypothetical protein